MSFNSFFNTAKTFTVKYAKKVLHTLRYSRIALFAASLVIGTIITVLFSGITLAYNVEYNGTVIAQIKTKGQYVQALSAAENMLYGAELKELTTAPKFHVTFTTKKNLDDSNTVADEMIKQSDSVSKGIALKVDGEIIACVPDDARLVEFISDYLENYVTEGEVSSEFVKEVSCVYGYYPNNLFYDIKAVEEIIFSLDVKTVQTIRSQKEIPYTSVTRKSDSRVLGDIQTVVTGVNGVKETVETIEMINKTAVKTVVESEVIISQPVQEIIVVGTKKDTSVSNVYVSQLDCIWPLKRVAQQVVSAYYGDGRNHKGVDIASPTGTPIYAAQAGTVVDAKYSNGYGYHIIVDHGNGYKTLYAHCSQLLVNVGEAIYQGQVIALVGSTGISTGSHLHFEVIKDGVNLNPASFIGL